MNPVHIHHRLVCEYLYPNGAKEKDKEIGRIRTDMLQLIQVSMSTNICLIYMFRGAKSVLPQRPCRQTFPLNFVVPHQLC